MRANFDAHTQSKLLNGPYCSSKGPFSQLSTKRNSTQNYFWVNETFFTAPQFFLFFSIFFVPNLFPKPGLRVGSQRQCVEAQGHVAASSVCTVFPLYFLIFYSNDFFCPFPSYCFPSSKQPYCPHSTADLPVTSNHLSNLSQEYLQSANGGMTLTTPKMKHSTHHKPWKMIAY